LITDFGTSKSTTSKQNKNTVNTLKTLPFASCEQLKDLPAHPSFDIWSLGISLYFLMARKLPYIGDDNHEVNMAIWTKPREKLSNNYSRSLKDLVDFCLDTDPDSRPNIEKILRYPLVR
jgi:serine/threonine protein kinase